MKIVEGVVMGASRSRGGLRLRLSMVAEKGFNCAARGHHVSRALLTASGFLCR